MILCGPSNFVASFLFLLVELKVMNFGMFVIGTLLNEFFIFTVGFGLNP